MNTNNVLAFNSDNRSIQFNIKNCIINISVNNTKDWLCQTEVRYI